MVSLSFAAPGELGAWGGQLGLLAARRSALSGTRVDREHEAEGAALAELRLDPHLTAVALDDQPADVQPQARARRSAGAPRSARAGTSGTAWRPAPRGCPGRGRLTSTTTCCVATLAHRTMIDPPLGEYLTAFDDQVVEHLAQPVGVGEILGKSAGMSISTEWSDRPSGIASSMNGPRSTSRPVVARARRSRSG